MARRVIQARRAAHEGLVVEPGRQERGERGRRPPSRSRRSDGQRFWLVGLEPVEQLDWVARMFGSVRRTAAQRDERVRLLDAGREDAARPVVLEAAADEAHAVGEQRRGERVARHGRPASAVEGERRAAACGRRGRLGGSRFGLIRLIACARLRPGRWRGSRGSSCRARRRATAAAHATWCQNSPCGPAGCRASRR